MYELWVERHFDAAHYLREYQGKCENLHGHRFRVVARVKAAGLDETGLAYDFAGLKKRLDEVLARYDHTCINDIPPFDSINASSENMAAAIYRELKEKLEQAPVTLSCIEVWESPVTGVAYYPD